MVLVFQKLNQLLSGKYYISILVETEVQELPKTNSSVGIDLGLKDFAILSNGKVYKNPKFFRTLEKKLAKEQAILSRRSKGLRLQEFMSIFKMLDEIICIRYLLR